MASTKEYRDFILEQLSEAPNIKPMYFVEDVDDKVKLAEIVEATVKGLAGK